MRTAILLQILAEASFIASVFAFSVLPVPLRHPQGNSNYSGGRSPTHRYRTDSPLFDSPEDVVFIDDIGKALEAIEQPVDVEEAIEALEQQTASVAASAGGVISPSDEGGVQVVVQTDLNDTEAAENQFETSKEELAGEIIDYITADETDRTERGDREAAVSASLYMNPATEKIASSLIITWEPAVAEILDRLARLSNPSRPLMVGLIGIPGSGKSTSAEIVTTLLGGMDDSQDEERAIIMPMDGYHLPLKTLAESPNSADLIYRRGAPDTFDPAGLFEALNDIAYGDEETVTLPGFDHAQGDPVPNQHTFTRSKHKIVLVEGIYLLHDDDGWDPVKRLFDWTIYIDGECEGRGEFGKKDRTNKLKFVPKI